MKPPARIAALLLLAACTTPALPEDQRIDGIDWILIEANGMPWLENVSLRLDGDRLTGIGPCNAYSGRREGGAPDFAARDLNMTAMACADPARMRAEAEYMDMLPQLTTLRRERDSLVLSGSDLILVYDRREARGDDVF